MNSTQLVCLLLIGGIIGYGASAVPNEIQKELDKTDDKEEFYRYDYIDQESCIEEHEAMYNTKTEECISQEPIVIIQEYTSSLTVEPVCEPQTIGNYIIKENCDKFLRWMEMDELIQFIKDNPEALTDEEEDILFSKAVGNMYPDMVDHEVENQVNVIMWRLVEEGYY